MSKSELISVLVNDLGEDREQLNEMSKKELEELLEELTDRSNLYPNGDNE